MKIVRGILSIMVCLSMMGCYMFSNLFPAGGQKNRTPGAAQGGNEVSAGDLEPVPVEDLSMEGLEPAVVEDITIRGQVILPEGVPWQFSDLTVFTAFGEAPVQPDGSFEVPAVRSPQKTLLVMAVLPSQTAALLGLFYPGRENETLELSAASTTRALLLFDPAFLEMPVDQQLYAADLGTGLMGFETLAQSVQTSLAADPLNPLDGDAHPELFSQSAQLALQVLTQMGAWPPPEITAGVSPAAGLAWKTSQAGGSARLASLIDPGRRSQSGVSPKSPWVFVEDDPNQTEPWVTLVNTSYAFYQVKVYITDPKTGEKQPWNNTDQKPWILERTKPYHQGFDPGGSLRNATTRQADLGDGYLSFIFLLDYDLSYTELLGTAIQGFLGVEAGAPEIQLLARLYKASVGMGQETITFIKALRGKSVTEAGTEFLVYFYKTIAELVKDFLQVEAQSLGKDAKSSWYNNLLKFVSHKAVFWAELAYSSSDIAFMVYSLANAPEQILEGGVQLDGKYPAVLLEVDPEKIIIDWQKEEDHIIQQSQEVSLNGSIRYAPANVETMTVEVNYAGENLDIIKADVVNGVAEFSSTYQLTKYSDTGSRMIRVLVKDENGLLLAQKSIPIFLKGGSVDGKVYTLLLSFDGGCDSDIPGYSTPSGNRITPLPLVIQGNKVSIRYDKTTGDKNLVAGGAGTYNPETGELSINFSSTYTIKYMGYDEKDNPIQVVGVESFIGTVTAVVTDDINLQYESFEGLARGHVEVFYPSTEMRKSEWYKEKNCSADALKATIFEGFVDAGL